MELNKIIELMEKNRKEYYLNGKSNLSDLEYDTLEEQVRHINPNHPILEKIGHAPSPLWKKAKHNIPMGSLNKCHSKEEFLKWADKFPEQLFEVQYKLDGLSLSLEYENSKFIRGISRGDGFEGEDLTPNITFMKNFKSTLVLSGFNGSIRAEILLNKNSFEIINKTLSEKEQYSNPRNAAAGISRRLDGLYCKYLELFYYDISYTVNEDEKIKRIENMALQPPYNKILDTQGILNFYEQIKKERDKLIINIDGIVIKVNSYDIQQREGSINNRPKAQIAWKFEPPSMQTTIKKVMWEIGRTGVLTPVAYYDPVEIDGTIVEKSTLHNVAEIFRLKIGIGDTIMLVKRGDIIPKCESVIEHKGIPIEIPTHCPSCHTLLCNDGIRLMCLGESCHGKHFQTILNFIKVVKIDSFGESLAEKLYELGKLKNLADIFNLKKEDIAGIEGWGEKSAETIINNIQNVRKMNPAIFLASLGIPSLSTSTAEYLWKKYGDINKIRTASVEDICTIKGYSTISATKIVEGLKYFDPQIDLLLAHVDLQEAPSAGGCLSGMSFCFTGAMEQPRSFYQGLVTKHGGKNDSTVTKATTFLVCNENKGSSKSRKAEQYGCKIINVAQFLEMIGDVPETENKPKLVTKSLFE